MHFLIIIIWEYIIVAGLIIFFVIRDTRRPSWFSRHKKISYLISLVLVVGIMVALSTMFFFPKILITKKTEIQISKINSPIKIVFISDVQVGNHKKTAWVEKIVKKTEKENPDLIILGGDLIDNEGNIEDETTYLEPLTKLVGEYPIYAITGNHEYGIGNKTREHDEWQTGDRSADLIVRFQKMNIPILKNQLICPEIKNQKICLYGIDDIWNRQVNFDDLKNYTDPTLPLILLTHNPDGILYWPQTAPTPDLVLSGHTHGGQIWLPFYGPLGRTGVDLGPKFYRGLNYWQNIPIFTSVGTGESAAAIRFWVFPEINSLTITKTRE